MLNDSLARLAQRRRAAEGSSLVRNQQSDTLEVKRKEKSGKIKKKKKQNKKSAYPSSQAERVMGFEKMKIDKIWWR